MNRLVRQPAAAPPSGPDTPLIATTTPPAATNASGMDLRRVHRAVAELRRGMPVILHTQTGPLMVLAAETADEAAIATLGQYGPTRPVLLLARRRAEAALARTPLIDPAHGHTVPEGFAAFALADHLMAPQPLRSLADPTQAQAGATLNGQLHEVALPAGAAAAIGLAKIGRLLPAVLTVPLARLSSASTPPLPIPTADLLDVDAAQVDAYPLAISVGLHVVAQAAVPLDTAPDARVVAFRPLDGGLEHLAIIVGQPQDQAAPLVRVHSACLTGDLLGSLRCDCGPQLRAALARMTQDGSGVLLYLAQEGRGIGIVNKLRAYAIQDRGEDTVDANLSLGWAVDERNFMPAAIMLEQLGISRVRLLTNNPAKVAALTACGIEVAAREPHVMEPNGVNNAYLRAKADRLGHLLD